MTALSTLNRKDNLIHSNFNYNILNFRPFFFLDPGYVALGPLTFDLLKSGVDISLMNLEVVAGLAAFMMCKLTVGICYTTEGGMKGVLTEGGRIGGRTPIAADAGILLMGGVGVLADGGLICGGLIGLPWSYEGF